MDVNKVLAEVEGCQCMMRGAETCSSASLCCCHGKYRRSCDLRCLCHGHCCNSLINTPELGIREGVLGRELFTKTNLPLNKIAFVVCGNILTTSDYENCYEEMMLQLAGSRAAPSVYLYCIKVSSWLGSAQGLPPLGDPHPHPDQYVIHHLNDMSGAANHSCNPNIQIQACWANNKVYAVGRTLRRIMLKEALTYDYNWVFVQMDRGQQELNLCRVVLLSGTFLSWFHC
ncbi:hypothetical protein BDL97_18G021700 [Sphagnum fallax]|nr:hypothetical protein BDL97_18G021700 [Sphagnum fallax]